MNTPRTDAHSNKMDNEDFDVELAKTYDFARQLERELIDMTALADRLAEALDFTMNGNTAKDQIPFIDASREALTAYENHKKGNTP